MRTIFKGFLHQKVRSNHNTNTDSRPHIFVITPMSPWPPVHGCQTGMIQHLAWLSQSGYRVSLLVLTLYLSCETKKHLMRMVDDVYDLSDGEGPKLSFVTIFAALKQVLLHFIVIYIAPRFSRKLRNRVKRFLGLPISPVGQQNISDNVSYKIVECSDRAVETTAVICNEINPSAVIVYYIFNHRCLDVIPKKTLKVINTFDKMSDRSGSVVAFGIEDAWACSPEYERECLLNADLILAIQPEEAQAFKELVPEREVIVFGVAQNVVEQIDNKDIVLGRILVVASDNASNVHGLNVFLTSIWPLVKSSGVICTLRIVGKVGNKISNSDPQIQIVGHVENLSIEYQAANVVINPTLAGTGLKIKTVEALSYAKPVVAWPNGVSGLKFDAQYPSVVVCKSNEDYAESIISLLTLEEYRMTMQERALKFSRENFSQQACYGEFGERLTQHILDAENTKRMCQDPM